MARVDSIRSLISWPLMLAALVVQAEIQPEPLPVYETLPKELPDSVLFAHDANFDALVAGRVVVLDLAKPTRRYLGAMDAAQFASFIQSRSKPELYVSETHYSRTTRGERTDVISIYDRESLKQSGEIVLPGGKRGQVVSHRYTLRLVDNDRFLLVFNFTPAASVTVIDTESRKIVEEVQIPGCGLIYPTGKRGFSSLCSNGAMFTAQLDSSGKLATQNKLPPLFDVDEDPLFDKPVFHKGHAYFPSYKSLLRVVDLSSDEPKDLGSWSLLTKEEQAENWRPGGWQITTMDDAGRIYLLMHKDGKDGTHKSGGPEVWVYDVKSKKRLQKIVLKNWGVSIEVTRGSKPLLAVTNGDMQIDVYDADSGKWKTMVGGAAAMPLSLHALRK
ncbi:amine dehydrogenase large subunit [Pseudoteredinibacter isoporae]|uniref:Methylamine dehydrogenase heavy chain n=1 Tax=Pseudoteredinibacter isoporae TaxID=570281 RepID=A0A7X0JRG8_9GAMM|nr:amine dehydrogenase large subunit [Pseudoteredinibacter isoporae]MBB6520944.1 methylamine dehydrogenase heavy chain [Pseudoteredinibacter isoporae]NHO86509.1 amine dehydrogenase [Pseudoteredinibacter isoporae]NIB25039.1 amine dehydrogenase [Pseudoteredinibacter isoporae]